MKSIRIANNVKYIDEADQNVTLFSNPGNPVGTPVYIDYADTW